MNDALDENAQLDVVISDLRATDEELEKLKGYIARGMGNNGTPPVVQPDGIDTKGARYVVTFTVLDPRHFDISIVKDWLHAAILVGWQLDATFVPRQ